MLEQNLHVTHPVMKAILELWDKHRNKVLVDLSNVRYVGISSCQVLLLLMSYIVCLCRSDGPVDIEHFRTLLVESACEHAEEKLRSSWYPHVIAMFNDPNAIGSACLVGQTKTVKERVYACVYTLLGNQLRGMLGLTIQQYVDLFSLENTTHLPQFKIHLCLEGQSMEFFPSIAELESAVVFLVETVATSMSNLSTIEVSFLALCIISCAVLCLAGLALWCTSLPNTGGGCRP